jgi:hypothetical protein
VSIGCGNYAGLTNLLCQAVLTGLTGFTDCGAKTDALEAEWFGASKIQRLLAWLLGF